MSLTRAFTRGLQPRLRQVQDKASIRPVLSTTLKSYGDPQQRTRKSPCHVIRNAYTPQHDQVHRLGKLLQSGFQLPYLGPHITWLLLGLRLSFSRPGSVKLNAHHYLMAEEAIKGQLLDPSSKEKDAISVASIMLKAVATTQSWKLWGERKHALSIRDLNTLEDANYALRHFKASHRGATPLSVLEDELTCLWGIPRQALRNAQNLTERDGELIDNLRLVAGKQFDQAEQNSKSIRAKLFVQNVGVPLAKRLCSMKVLTKKICHSKPTAEQIWAELNFITVMEAKQIEAHLHTIEGADVGKQLTANLLFKTKKTFSARQLSSFRELEKRYVNVISRVERLPDQKGQEFKENLLVLFEAERAGWAVLAAKTKVDDWMLKYNKRK